MTEKNAKYRIAVIGGGRKGTQHARAYALNPKAEIVAIADMDQENLELFKKRFNLKKGYTDYREMLAVEKPDIVAPILPVAPNPKVVVECASAPGVKGIFCEKPASVSLEEADRMVEACRSRNIKFAAGDAYRNYHQLWEARKVIESGEIGEVQAINLYQPTDEISGGGCQGLSVMRMFAWDDEIDWLTGWVRHDPWSDNDQGMGGYVRFKNKIECFIHLKPNAKSGIEILCSKGVFWSDWTTFRMWKMKDKGRLLHDMEEMVGRFEDAEGWGPGLDAEGWVSMSTRQADSIQAIIDAVDTNTEPRCSGDNMRQVLEIAIAMRESHQKGFIPVKLPIQDRKQKIVPHTSRLENKKPLLGHTEYYNQMRQRKEA